MPAVTKIQQARREYGSFRQAVEHYAGMGCSRAMTARYLGIDRGHFREMVRRHNLDGLFPARRDMLPECRTAGHPAHAERNRRLARQRVTDAELLAEVAQHRTTRDFVRLARHSLSTIYARFGSYLEARRLARG